MKNKTLQAPIVEHEAHHQALQNLSAYSIIFSAMAHKVPSAQNSALLRLPEECLCDVVSFLDRTSPVSRISRTFLEVWAMWGLMAIKRCPENSIISVIASRHRKVAEKDALVALSKELNLICRLVAEDFKLNQTILPVGDQLALSTINKRRDFNALVALESRLHERGVQSCVRVAQWLIDNSPSAAVALQRAMSRPTPKAKAEEIYSVLENDRSISVSEGGNRAETLRALVGEAALPPAFANVQMAGPLKEQAFLASARHGHVPYLTAVIEKAGVSIGAIDLALQEACSQAHVQAVKTLLTDARLQQRRNPFQRHVMTAALIVSLKKVCSSNGEISRRLAIVNALIEFPPPAISLEIQEHLVMILLIGADGFQVSNRKALLHHFLSKPTITEGFLSGILRAVIEANQIPFGEKLARMQIARATAKLSPLIARSLVQYVGVGFSFTERLDLYEILLPLCPQVDREQRIKLPFERLCRDGSLSLVERTKMFQQALPFCTPAMKEEALDLTATDKRLSSRLREDNMVCLLRDSSALDLRWTPEIGKGLLELVIECERFTREQRSVLLEIILPHCTVAAKERALKHVASKKAHSLQHRLDNIACLLRDQTMTKEGCAIALRAAVLESEASIPDRVEISHSFLRDSRLSSRPPEPQAPQGPVFGPIRPSPGVRAGAAPTPVAALLL